MNIDLMYHYILTTNIQKCINGSRENFYFESGNEKRLYNTNENFLFVNHWRLKMGNTPQARNVKGYN